MYSLGSRPRPIGQDGNSQHFLLTKLLPWLEVIGLDIKQIQPQRLKQRRIVDRIELELGSEKSDALLLQLDHLLVDSTQNRFVILPTLVEPME